MLQFIPIDAQKIMLVLLLSFLIGLEHEEHKRTDKSHYLFGGVRTFPLLGILGYTAALLSSEHPAILAVGLGAVGVLMFLSFYHKLSSDVGAGITSEASGILTFLLGAVVYQEHFWIATTLVVAGVLLLELKTALEGLAQKISADEILTFTKFLLLAAVILPILPDTPLTRFQINLQEAWVIVVAISSISYASYLLQKFVGARSAIVSAIVGGAYSSTVTTIALAKRSQTGAQARLYSGAMLASSGVMYIRLAILVSLFNAELRMRLAPMLCVIGGIAVLFGALWAYRTDRRNPRSADSYPTKNPLEIKVALFFAGIFLSMFVLIHLILEHLGTAGIYGLSILTGFTDVDPYVLGLTQSAGLNTPVMTALIGILLAAASNNLLKGVYAFFFSERETGKLSFLFLASLAVVGLLPIFYFLR